MFTGCLKLTGTQYNHYNGPYILRPPIQVENCGLELYLLAVLKFKYIEVEKIRVVPFMGGLEPCLKPSETLN